MTAESSSDVTGAAKTAVAPTSVASATTFDRADAMLHRATMLAQKAPIMISRRRPDRSASAPHTGAAANVMAGVMAPSRPIVIPDSPSEW